MIFPSKEDLIRYSVRSTDTVLDVGFWGQGVSIADPNWVHALLKKYAKEVWGLDIEFNPSSVSPNEHYIKGSAEDFSISKTFDVIFAGDLIEHLSNPGLFLQSAACHVAPGGCLIITTPNCFNLFNMTEKLSKGEPTVNHDHTCYFNPKTIAQLLQKNGWIVDRIDYVYSLGVPHRESFKKRILNGVYWLLSRFTEKYSETLVVVAHPHDAARS